MFRWLQPKYRIRWYNLVIVLLYFAKVDISIEMSSAPKLYRRNVNSIMTSVMTLPKSQIDSPRKRVGWFESMKIEAKIQDYFSRRSEQWIRKNVAWILYLYCELEHQFTLHLFRIFFMFHFCWSNPVLSLIFCWNRQHLIRYSEMKYHEVQFSLMIVFFSYKIANVLSEFGARSTIHCVAYVFDKKRPWFER